ncbi:MAG: sulfatase-like hydrolase/transferase, partial [Bacteroidota bacterium]
SPMPIRLLVRLTILMWLPWLACLPSSPDPPDKPNILFIFADDQTIHSIQALGNQEIYTPNLDRLVARGATFNNAYNMGAWNGAVCTASRSMLVSGRSVWRVNQFRRHWQKGDSLEKTWPQMMSAAGYRTYQTGKWHVDAPAEKIFNYVAHVRPGMPRDTWNHAQMVDTFAQIKAAGGGFAAMAGAMPIGYNRPLGPDDQSWSPTDSSLGGFWEGGIHWSEVLRDDALGFINQASQDSLPFFMYLAFNAAHDPRQAPQEFLDRYPLDKVSAPVSWLPHYPYQIEMGCGPTVRDEALAPFPRTEYALKVHNQEYYALVTHMDQQIGKILDALEASGQAENTYIFFTADHGLAMGRHGLLGKQNLFEHSAKVPFMVVGPGIEAGTQVDAPIYLQDVMASSLELAGAAKPAYVEFESVLSLAQQKADAVPREEIYGGYINYQRMIRRGQDKLIIFPAAEKILLFDLATDPEEQHDLAEAPENQEKVKQLFQDLIKMQKKMGDTLDLSSLFLAKFES